MPIFGSNQKIIFNKVSAKLNLTDEQQTKAKDVLENARIRVKPLIEELKANHLKIEKLGSDGVYNEKSVADYAEKQAVIAAKLFVEKEKTKAELFALLSSVQRTQATQMIEDWKTRIKKRKGEVSGKILEKLSSLDL